MKLNKKNIIFIVSIVVSAVCTWLFIRKIEWESLGKAMSDVDIRYIIPATIMALLVYVVRAFRWQGLISHIKPVSVISLLSITSIGFMANNILPARVGEVLRPFLLYKKEGVKFSTSFATAIVERIFDMLGLIIFAIAIIALLPEHPQIPDTSVGFHETVNHLSGANKPVIHSLKKWTGFFATIGGLTIVLLFFIVIKPDFFKKVLSRFCFFLPHKIKDKVFSLYDSFVYGLKILENKTQTVWLLALSVLIWIVGTWEIYLLGFSFQMHLPFVGAGLVALCLALAVALPQAPGFIGVFHIAVLKALNIFGIHTPAAQSYAIILWVISVFPVTIMGFVFLWKEGIAFREVIKLEEEIADGKLEEIEGVSKELNNE